MSRVGDGSGVSSMSRRTRSRDDAFTVVYRGPVFAVESGVMREPGGVRERRDIVRHQGSVAILPVHADGTVTLVRQFRAPFRRSILEIPAGRVDRGESGLAAARRELREELGLSARRFQRLLRIVPTPGYCDEAVVLYRASGLTQGVAEPEEDERITPVRLSLRAAMRTLAAGGIPDAKTAVALLLEARRRR